jgi:hypothetical protein
MDTLTINKLLKNVSCYIGTFSRDALPKTMKLNSSLIVNTDTSDKPGEHWIAICKNIDGTGEYFDSYGLPPLHKELIVFMFQNFSEGWTYNTVPLQCLDCVTCGHYCVVFVKLKCFGIQSCEFTRLFTNNLSLNDVIVKWLIKF